MSQRFDHGVRSSYAHKNEIAFAALFLLFALTSLCWLRLHKAPPNWDDSWYLSNSLALYGAWTDGGVVGFAHRFLASLEFKAPLITALPLPFYWLLGRRWHAAYLVNLAAMLVLFGAVWAIANRLRGPRAAWMAVYIAGTLPLLYGLSRWFLVEYPLTACVAVAFWLTLAAAGEQALWRAAAFGVVCGAGLMLKADFPLFVAPMAVSLLAASRERGRTVLAIAVPALVLTAPWYVLHWRATWENALSAGYGASAIIQGTGSVFAASSFFKYLAIVAERGVSAYYLVLTAVAVTAIAARRYFAILRKLAPLGLWLAPFLVFAFGGNKDVRYIAPILPAFAVGAACLLDAATIDHRWAGSAALIFPLIALSATSFGWPYRSPDIGYAYHYAPYSWQQDEILSTIAETALFPHGGHKVLLLGTDRGCFNAENFQLSAVQDRLPLLVTSTAYTRTLDDLLEQARNADYFVYKEGGEPESPFFNTHTAELIKCLRESPEWIEIPFGRGLPDGGKAHLMRRTDMRAASESRRIQ